MANNFADLIVDSVAAMGMVSRELTGYIPAVERNFAAANVGIGQKVIYDVTPALTAQNITAAMTVPTPADVAVTKGEITMTKQKAVPFGYTGEEQLSLINSGGAIILSRQGKLVAQAIRTIVNEVESDLANAAVAGASRAYGVAGTTPFSGGNTADAAELRKILVDNGAPPDRQLVLDTAAGAKLATAIGWNGSRGSVAEVLEDQGVILAPHGLQIRETGVSISHTKGTGASATTNAAGYAIGATVITLAAAGTGTIVTGDVITFAGDSNKYVVTSGDTNVADGGTITIASPGLRVAIPAAATAITLTANHSKMAAFSRGAVHLVARAPALPDGGDSASNRTTVTDGRSGLQLSLAEYKGYHMTRIEVALVWGVKAVDSRSIALLIG